MENQKPDDLMDFIVELVRHHRGEFLGTIIGILVGFMIMYYGFLWTAFICMCGIIGYKIGKRIDSDEVDWKALVERYIPSGRR